MCSYNVTSLDIIITYLSISQITNSQGIQFLATVVWSIPLWSYCAFSVSVFPLANETELAFFKMSDYEKYKANPQTVWWDTGNWHVWGNPDVFLFRGSSATSWTAPCLPSSRINQTRNAVLISLQFLQVRLKNFSRLYFIQTRFKGSISSQRTVVFYSSHHFTEMSAQLH